MGSSTRRCASSNDVYTAAWMTAECASVLYEHDPDRIRQAVERYAEPVRSLGYVKLIARYEELLSRT
jgi:hypothetical protein